MSSIKDLIENPHPIFKANHAYWNFLLQSYEGGRSYCNADLPGSKSESNLLDRMFRVFADGKEILPSNVSGNLFRHPKERNDDYNDRVRMSFYYNFCAPIIDIYTNHLFKEAVLEDFGSIESTIDEVRDNIDVQESSISEFRQELAEMSQLYGHCFVLVDSPAIPGDLILTRQDQINQRVFPYATIYAPQSVLNWSLDKFGNAYWVLVKEYADVNIDPKNYDPKAVCDWTFKLWTRTEWYQYDREYRLIASGVHGLGIVPIVCVYSKKSKTASNFLGISDLSDISFIARDIYNSCSELKQILRDQTFAFLAIQGDASEYNELSVGTSKALLYPENRNAPQYVSPPQVNAQVYFDHIDRQVRKIYQLAKLEGGSAQQVQTATVQSGTSKAWDFNETNSALAKKAAMMEDGEIRIWKMFAAWEGKEFDGKIQYPNEFSTQSIMDDLTELEKEQRLALGSTFELEVKKAIQKKKFPRATEEELEQMADEAEAKGNPNDNQNGNGGMDIKSRLPFLFKSKTPNEAVKNGGKNE
jgi:hypothetical protein